MSLCLGDDFSHRLSMGLDIAARPAPLWSRSSNQLGGESTSAHRGPTNLMARTRAGDRLERGASLHGGLWILALGPLFGGCIQSVHQNGPNDSPVPGGPVQLLEERPGPGRPVKPGDRIVVDFVGRYGDGTVWGEGPLTLVVGPGSYPGKRAPLRVGDVISMQYWNDPNDTTVRLVPFPGGDTENEAYQVRRDRGLILVEHRVRKVCRPLKIFFLQTGLGPIEAGLGCWPILRLAPRRLDPARVELGSILDPKPIPRPAADPTLYGGKDGLHRAVREGRPELVGWLLAHGRNLATADSSGFLPIHYAGSAQRELERFVPAFEPSYLDVVDTLLAHGAAIDAPVERALRPPGIGGREYEGQTAVGFAATECADRLVRHLLDRGARPDAFAKGGIPALTGAAGRGCPDTVELLLTAGATVDLDPQGGGTPLERLIAASAFHQGHLASARLLVRAGAKRDVAAKRLADRLRDPGQGGFGFSNRPMARRILKVLGG